MIDEFGWRHFGELYADHEDSFWDGPVPLTSHYNNQYDPLEGCLRRALLDGDARWFELGDDLARHIRDIDVYHTDRDRSEFNGGLFWHTDHYLDAATVGHRSFSKHHAAAKGGVAGGGPSLGHVYTGGLLLHHRLTGDAASRDTLLEIAEWVMGLSAGPSSFLDALDLAFRREGYPVRSLAGLRSVIWTLSFTRATGNPIQTLLDAFETTRERRYLRRAERLIRRVATPRDDIVARDLGDVEATWSYTVVMRALARYLDLKRELDEPDATFGHARDTLLHYARFIPDGDPPYLGKPEILEFVNETWAAQDLRKVAILLQASAYAPEDVEAEHLRRVAFERFDIAWTQLHDFDEQHTRTRPIALVLQNVDVHQAHRERDTPLRHDARWRAPIADRPSGAGPLPTWRRVLQLLGQGLARSRPSSELRWIRSRLKNQ